MADLHAEKILILDFGSQYTQLIARRVRELHVYCEIHPCTMPIDQIRAFAPRGIVLSGSPFSVEQPGAPLVDRAVFEMGVPVLGVCYGLQLMAKLLGGAIDRTAHREYGHARVEVIEPVGPFGEMRPGEHLDVWMSHGDKVSAPPRGFRVIGRSDNSPFCAVANPEKRLYAIQFHAEVAHTPRGRELYEAFLEECGVTFSFRMGAFIEDATARIRERVGKERAICALSGGVDSAVVALLLHRAIGPQLQCIFVDNGLLREGEAEQVQQTFAGRFHLPLRTVDARARFLEKLRGFTDPERKRKIIGNEFIAVFEQEVERDRAEHGEARFLAQGTLYPDVIESVSFKGPSQVIKSHHNVGGLPERMRMHLIEPLRELFKDEVRALGRELGAPAVPRSGARHPRAGRDHRGAPAARAQGRRHRPGRGGQRRPAGAALAGVRGAVAGAQRGSDGRRAHLRIRMRVARRGEPGWDDRRLGPAPVRPGGEDLRADHQRSARHQPGRL